MAAAPLPRKSEFRRSRPACQWSATFGSGQFPVTRPGTLRDNLCICELTSSSHASLNPLFPRRDDWILVCRGELRRETLFRPGDSQKEKFMKHIPGIVLAIVSLSAVTTNAQKAATIREVDFDNFTYAWNDASDDEVPMGWNWLTSTPDEHFRVIHGKHRFYSPEQDHYERQHSPLISVDSATYGDLAGDGLEEAVVALNYSLGGTANWDYLYVYKLGAAKRNFLRGCEPAHARTEVWFERSCWRIS